MRPRISITGSVFFSLSWGWAIFLSCSYFFDNLSLNVLINMVLTKKKKCIALSSVCLAIPPGVRLDIPLWRFLWETRIDCAAHRPPLLFQCDQARADGGRTLCQAIRKKLQSGAWNHIACLWWGNDRARGGEGRGVVRQAGGEGKGWLGRWEVNGVDGWMNEWTSGWLNVCMN